MWTWLEYLIYGTTTSRQPVSPSVLPSLQEVALPSSYRSSQVFDSHVLSEAAAGGKNPQAVSLAWDEGRAYGFNTAPQSWMGMTPRERKETLLSIFLANPWASNCIDTIGLYITSGSYTIEPRVENPDKSQYKAIEQFLQHINEDWDFTQFVYDQLTDEMIFGESFTEYTLKAGKPYELFPIDCLTMDTEHDKYGRAMRYKQQLTSTSITNDLDPNTIIRWWNPHKRAKVDPFSPLERVQDAILLDKKMTNWTTNFFQKGAKFPFSIEGMSDQDEADRFLTWFKANYTGEKNAQNPFVSWGGAKITPLGKGSIDIDFDKGLDRQQVIVLSALHVPPSIACISESGNRLTDMSDSQRKILEYIACNPRKKRFFEKFNYRIIHRYFGTDYNVGMRYANFRNDKDQTEIEDKRIRNGSLLVDEARQEDGREPYSDGAGAIPIIITTKEVTPLPRIKDLEDEQRQTAQVSLVQAKANADLAQTKAKQAKEPPPSVQPVAQNGTPPPAPAKQDDGEEESWRVPLARQPHTVEELVHDLELLLKKAQQSGSTNKTVQRSSEGARPEIHHTGMMLAFLLDPQVASQLALPDGEPAEEMHITLAYLGDMNDPPALDGSYTPHTMPEPIKRVLTAVTSAACPLSGKIAGIGRFTTQSDDETPTPIIANVDVPGLTELRTELVEALSQANYFVADTHGYTAHITLAYIDQDAPMPIEDVPPLELTFDTVWLCVGDERIPFKLGGDSYNPSKEPHGQTQQETNSQGDASDDLAQGQNQDQGDGSLHPIQEVANGSGEGDAASSDSDDTLYSDAATLSRSASRERTENDEVGPTSLSSREDGSQTEARGSTDQQSVADRSKADLARWIAALFAGAKVRGMLTSPTLTTALTAYMLTDKEQEELAYKLAEVNQAAQKFAYTRDMRAIGLTPHIEESLVSRVGDLISWGRVQVASIVSTFQNLFSSFLGGLPTDTTDVVGQADGWMDRYGEYKSTQIANNVWGIGANDGSMAAIEDVLDAADDQTQKYPAAGRVRVRVVPGESSSDRCADYAGRDYSIEEYRALGISFPAHPSCIHSVELFVGEGDDA